jgi:ZIP family zinc transporter
MIFYFYGAIDDSIHVGRILMTGWKGWNMTPFMLATFGGLISFAATSFGSVLALLRLPGQRFEPWRLPIDFALGLMISAVAFSLVGPAAVEAFGDWQRFAPIAFGFYAGVLLIVALHRLMHRFEGAKGQQGQLLLAIVLMVHNFPEGLASGAALVGLDTIQARTVLSSIALQNIPEGLLMVICLRSLGVAPIWALAGGLGSGVIELFGGMGAGLLLHGSPAVLPFLLATAGGAMLTSVIVELKDSTSIKRRVWSSRFALGFLTIPLLNGVLGLLQS